MIDRLTLVQRVLENLNIESLNEIQQEILDISEKKDGDVVLLSPTGSGKTLAYLLPLILRLDADAGNTQALVVVPTRELAMQTERVVKSLKIKQLTSACCYGGHPMSEEVRKLETSPMLLIGTPGRLLDHLDKKNIVLDGVSTLVLDEFDKSLELGFQDEMADIISRLPGLKRRILTSATKCEIPEFVNIRSAAELNFLSEESIVPDLSVYKILNSEKDKLEPLFRLFCNIEEGSALVFCNQRESVDRISSFLSDKGIINEAFHGGMEQPEREKALARFRNGSSSVLISTDLAARGLDIPDVKYVIHYHMPLNAEAYIHRNGRTARMHASGTVFILLGPEEKYPEFLPQSVKLFEIPGSNRHFPTPCMDTLYIGLGKKDKISKADIVGFLIQKGNLDKGDVGIIEIKEYHTFVAIAREKIKSLLVKIKSEKIKNKKTKFEIADR